MNLEPKAEGAARTLLYDGLPKTLEEAVAYIESKFEIAGSGIAAPSDAFGNLYVTISFGAKEDTPNARQQLVWAWLMAMMDRALEVPRNQLFWRQRPAINTDADGSIAITSRSSMI